MLQDPPVPPSPAPCGFYKDLKLRCGRRWYESIQYFEKIHEKLGQARSHIDFLRKCLDFGVTPIFVRDKYEPWNRSEEKHQKLVEKHRLKCRKEFWISRCFNLEREITKFLMNYQRNLSNRLRKTVFGLANFRLSKSFSESQRIHEKKINNLLANSGLIFHGRKNHSIQKNCDIFVKNLSSKPLTETEKSVLSLGGNFGIAPSELPVLKVLSPIISAMDFLSLKNPRLATEFQHEAVRILSNARLPSPNLSPEQLHALRTLKKDNSRVILPADKGSMTVVIDREDYVRLENDLLNDEGTYRPLELDPTPEISAELVDKFRKINRSGKIDKEEYKKLYQSSGSVPLFYGLPKIHKDPVRLRPITSCIDSVDESLAKHLTSILQPLCHEPLKNSMQFVKKIRNLHLEPLDRLVSFDVVSLFTSIPLDFACEIIGERLYSDATLANRTSLSPDTVLDLLKFCLKNSVFRNGSGKYFLQLEGTAMGKSFSPVVAEIVLQHLENLIFRAEICKPKFWTRYVDDVFAIWNHGEEKIPEFLAYLNELIPGIKFTVELEKNGALPFLDVLVQRKETEFETSIYRKATHSGRYLNNASCHLPSQKLSAISSIAFRARQICSSKKLLEEEFSCIRNDFRMNGFSDFEIERALFPKPRPPQPTTNRNLERKKVFTLPFCGASSFQLKRLFGKYGLQAAFRPNETLRSVLTKVKSKREPAETTNCVYCLVCSCGEIYIGESKRRVEVRWEEHERKWRNKDPVNSAFKGHFSHTPEFSRSILAREKNFYLRRAKEAILIRRAKLQGLKSLVNSNSGRQLDHIVDSIVEKMPNIKV